MLDGGGTIQSMGVVKINGLNPKSAETLLASDRHIRGVATEGEARRQGYGAEFGGDKHVFALLWVQSNPSPDDLLCISLGVQHWVSSDSHHMASLC